MKNKTVEDIKTGDKLNFNETGFEYVVTWVKDLAILVIFNSKPLWIPKSLIEVSESLLSTSGYRLFRLKSFPGWWIKKNNIY